MKSLNVILYGRHVATLTQDGNGSRKLEYVPGLDAGASLSAALPYRDTPYAHRPTNAFIEGLVPENENTRQGIAREFNLHTWENPFLLLEHIGLDCAGAVQFFPSGEDEASVRQDGSLKPVSEEEIGARLRQTMKSSSESWMHRNEHWSLAGAQTKFALRWDNGAWHEAQGAEPTTHIFKPGIMGLEDQALNEHLCLRTLRRLELKTAETEFKRFDGTPAVISRRYDRISSSNGLLRVHQEDLCQAFSLPPRRKYESDGGPSAVRIVSLIRENAGEHEAETFVQALIANYLLGAPDAHAKNYSLLRPPRGGVVLAPLYDVASGLAYGAFTSEGIPTGQKHYPRAAMKIGGESRFGSVNARHWTRFAKEARLDPHLLRETVEFMAVSLPEAFEAVCREESEAIGGSSLPEKLAPAISHLCECTLSGLSEAP